MGDVDVAYFLETLKLLIPKVESSNRRRRGLRSLEKEITYMGEFLKATEKKRYEHLEVMRIVKQIKDLVFKAECGVELFEVRANRTLKDNPSLCLGSVIRRIKTLTAEIRQIYNENMYDINGLASKKIKLSVSKNEGGTSSSGQSKASGLGLVGFKEEVNSLLTKLHNYGDGGQLEIIAIIGAGGGGKTTLAREVYEHQLTKVTFVRAWVTVSQGYDNTMKRDLLIDILKSVSPTESGDDELGENILKCTESGDDGSDDELGENTLKCTESGDDELGENILKCLKRKKYLIVMDDMWGNEAWNDIQRSFPRDCQGSKVLFTSRMSIEPNNISCVPHRLRPLPESYSWELLQEKVFGKKYCPPELVGIGKNIVEKCEGLPLAIVTVAGILTAEDKTQESWEEVEINLSSTIAKNEDGCMKILELSYNHLPLHLKMCFLYIGGFPEDSKILVRELIWLWIAEGFIQQSKEDKSLEDVAKDYLSNLIDRNLVIEATKRSSGEVKTCRIHDLLRELCLKKAEEDNFLVQMDKVRTFSPSAILKHRRLIGNLFFPKLFEKPCTQNIRSFLCLNSDRSFQNDCQYFFPENFELLRVLSLMSNIDLLEIGRGHLVHLRYLALCLPLCGWRYTLPFSHLFSLETLHLKLLSPKSMSLHRDIFKMVKLRHLYSKRGVFEYHSSYLKGGYSSYLDSSSKLDSLQTLYRICACESCRKFLERTPNLRKLGLHGEGMGYQYVNADLEFLRYLEALTIIKWEMIDYARSHEVPLKLKFPPTLVRLTLAHTFLSWEQLSSLQTLPRLEVLKLSNIACEGEIWNKSEHDEGFSQLKYLRLQSLSIKEWDATEDQFPRLEVLVVRSCERLKQIPIEFANLNELQKIEVTDSSRSVEDSARKIQKERINNRGDDGGINLLAEDNVYEVGVRKYFYCCRSNPRQSRYDTTCTLRIHIGGKIVWGSHVEYVNGVYDELCVDPDFFSHYELMDKISQIAKKDLNMRSSEISVYYRLPDCDMMDGLMPLTSHTDMLDMFAAHSGWMLSLIDVYVHCPSEIDSDEEDLVGANYNVVDLSCLTECTCELQVNRGGEDGEGGEEQRGGQGEHTGEECGNEEGP